MLDLSVCSSNYLMFPVHLAPQHRKNSFYLKCWLLFQRVDLRSVTEWRVRASFRINLTCRNDSLSILIKRTYWFSLFYLGDVQGLQVFNLCYDQTSYLKLIPWARGQTLKKNYLIITAHSLNLHISDPAFFFEKCEIRPVGPHRSSSVRSSNWKCSEHRD